MELIVAIGIITTGVFAAWNLLLANFSGEQEARMRIVGANLAREGLEVVKNIRDSNWLYDSENTPPRGWDYGLVGDGTGTLANIFSDTPTINFGPNSFNHQSVKLYLDAQGFFIHIALNNQLTPYQRLITIKNICCPVSANPFKCLNYNFVIKNSGVACDANQLKVGLNVRSEVRWIRNGKTKSIIAEEQLFDWK